MLLDLVICARESAGFPNTPSLALITSLSRAVNNLKFPTIGFVRLGDSARATSMSGSTQKVNASSTVKQVC